MKNLFTIFLLFIALRSSAQVTVFLQPHFTTGKEGTLYGIDTTSPNWPGNPNQYCLDSTYTTYPDFMFNTTSTYNDTAWIRHIVCFTGLSDTSVIPHGAVIDAALLHLYGVPNSGIGNWGNTYFTGSIYESYGPNTGWLYELADTFNANTVNWINAPGIKHTDSVTIVASSAQWGEDDSMNVTFMVADMVAHSNTGFLARLQNEVYGNERLFGSCYYSDSTKHPSLKVTYHMPPLGIQSVDNTGSSFSVFPNPATTQLTITSSQNINQISITNLIGQTVFTQLYNSAHVQVDISGMPTGIYFVKVNNTTITKFVKE